MIRMASCLSAMAWVSALGLPANAAVIVNLDANGFLTPRFPSDATQTYRVRLDPLVAITGVEYRGGPTLAERIRARFDFPAWTFVVGGAIPGVFQVNGYDVHVDSDLPFNFTVDYLPPAGFVPPGQLNWMQFIHTNAPCKPGLVRPYIDPQCMGPAPGMPDDARPFYWTAPERFAAVLPGGGLRFLDYPSRPLQAGLFWYADLYLTTWDMLDPGTVTIWDGLRWGFRINCIGPEAGPNATTGVAVDKIPSEQRGIVDSATTCPVDTPEPAGTALILAGLLGLALAGFARRSGSARRS